MEIKIVNENDPRSFNSDYWCYLYYEFSGEPPVFEPINSINYHDLSTTPVELLTYNLNIQEFPRVNNIMAKQSSYGLDKVIGIKSKFTASDVIDEVPIDYSGSVIKFYFPNFKYNENGDKVGIDIALPSDARPSSNNYCKYVYVLDSSKNKDDPIAIITGDTYNNLSRKIYDNGLISLEGIVESSNKRVFSILLTSGGKANEIAEVSTHISQKFNEHQGQSSLRVCDLRYGTYISKLLQELLSNDVRMTCIDGVGISSDFTKFYLGSYTQYKQTNLVTSVRRESIVTDEGEDILYY